MLISQSFLVTPDICYDLSEVWDWSLVWNCGSPFVWSFKAQNSRDYFQSFVTAQGQNLLSKTRELVKPLGNKHSDTGVFFNNLNTSFSTVLGLTMNQLLLHTVHQIPR